MWLIITNALGIFRGVNWKILAIGGTILLVVFGLWYFKETIKEQVYQTIYAEQVEQKLAQKEREIQLMQKLLSERDRQVENLTFEKKEIQRRTSKIKEVANDPTAEDGTVAPVLKNVIESIRNDTTRIEPRKNEETLNNSNSVIDRWLKGEKK